MTQIEFIKKWRLNKGFIAVQSGLHPYTFKMKLQGKKADYKFTQADFRALDRTLQEMKNDLDDEENLYDEYIDEVYIY